MPADTRPLTGRRLPIMKRFLPAIRLLFGEFVIILATVGCSSGGANATLGAAPSEPTAASATSVASATQVAGAPLSAQNVCLAMAEPLVLAALGEGIGEPESGDIAGGDGVYCYFPAAGDAATNVEAQVDEMSEAEFRSLAEQIGVTEPLPGVGTAAFSLDGAYTGIPGASVMAWDDGVGATILIERDGDQAEMTAAATALAVKLLADL